MGFCEFFSSTCSLSCHFCGVSAVAALGPKQDSQGTAVLKSLVVSGIFLFFGFQECSFEIVCSLLIIMRMLFTFT